MFNSAIRRRHDSFIVTTVMNWMKYGLVTVVLIAATYTGNHIRKARRQPQPTIYHAAQPDTMLPERLVKFAETLIGTPYNYGCASPDKGFDCSGFVGYVFGHFDLKVPRSSVEFTNVGKEIDTSQAKRGDLILFTGTNPGMRTVGHIGIITSHTDSLRFIHSSSGKEYSVTVTALNNYYRARFMKIVRVFDEYGRFGL